MTNMTARIRIELGDRISAPLRRISGQIETTMGRARRAAEQTGKSMERVHKAMRGMGSAGRSMSFKLTAPVIAFGALSLRAAANFEAAMNKVGALSGATAKELNSLRSQALKLGKTTVFTATQAADAQAFLAMAGFKTNKIMAALPGTLQLAAAAGIDLGRAADITSNILTGFGKSADELGHVNNVLVGTFTNSNTTLEELGESMKFVAPVARGAGMAFEETAAAIAMMGNAGVKGGLAGRSLRMAIAKLLNPTKEIMRTFKSLKINESDLYDSEGALRSLADIMGLLKERGATTGQVLAIFGTEAGPNMQALMDQGIDKMVEFTDKLKEIGNVAEKIAKAQLVGARGETLKLASAFEGLQLAIADSGVLAAFTKMVEAVTSWLGELSKASPATFRFVTVLALILAAIGPLLIGIGQIGIGIYGLTIAFSALKAMQLGALFVSIAGGVKALGAALLLNPIGLIITAIGVAAFLLVTRFDDIKKSLKALRGFAGLALDYVVNKITALRNAFANVLPDWLKEKMGIDVSAKMPPTPSVASAYAGRGRGGSRGDQRTDVGGELFIKIDSEGRPKVAQLKSNNPSFDLNVDTGLVMSGG